MTEERASELRLEYRLLASWSRISFIQELPSRSGSLGHRPHPLVLMLGAQVFSLLILWNFSPIMYLMITMLYPKSYNKESIPLQ